jgi:hypothetical protein
MDRVEHVKKLREEYERALDAAESRRSAYHEAVLELYQGGTPLREIAKELGLSHQRVHQIVSGEPPRRSKLPRAAGGAAAIVLILAAATFGALRLVHALPFGRATAPSRVSVPDVVNEPAAVAMRRVTDAGLRVRVFYRHTTTAPDRVYLQRGAAGKHVARGSLVILFVAGPHPSIGHGTWQSGFAFVAARQISGFRPGGAVFRRKREVVARATPIGEASLWIAPDRVSRSARCSWLQVGRMALGGTCYQPSGRGLPEVVPHFFSYGSPPRSKRLLLIWGRVGPGVDRLTLVSRRGKRTIVPVHDGMFLVTVPVLPSRWRHGGRPSSLVARDTQGHVVDKRPLRLDLARSY